MSIINMKEVMFMVTVGKVKFDNNYWARKSDGTWSNTWTFYEVLKHDFGAYNLVYVSSIGRISLTSTDGGATFTEGELEDDGFQSATPTYINIPDENIDALVRKKLNPMNQNKIITWEEPMHEVAEVA